MPDQIGLPVATVGVPVAVFWVRRKNLEVVE